MGIGKTLSAILAEKNTNVNELAERMNVAPTTIYSMIKRDSSKADITFLARMCKELDVRMERFYEDYVSEKEHNVFSVSSEEYNYVKKYRSLDDYGKKAVVELLNTEYERCNTEPEYQIVRLPSSLLRASAGTGLWLEEEYTSWVDVPDTPTARQANIVIEVAGDSMQPLYSDGDKVLVRIQPDIEIGDVGIFVVDNEGYIKKKGIDELISVNPEYDNIPISEFTECRCFGKVLGKTEILE